MAAKHQFLPLYCGHLFSVSASAHQQAFYVDHTVGELNGKGSENFIVKPHCPNRHLGNKERSLKFLVNTFRDYFLYLF